MGIDNFSKTYFTQEHLTTAQLVESLRGKNIGVFFDSTLIVLSPGTNLRLWLSKFNTLLHESTPNNNRLFVVKDSDNKRGYSKICQSILRKPAQHVNSIFKYETLAQVSADACCAKMASEAQDVCMYSGERALQPSQPLQEIDTIGGEEAAEVSTFKKLAPNLLQSPDSHDTVCVEAEVDGDQSILQLVNTWLALGDNYHALVCSRDQDFLYYYLGDEHVTNFFMDYPARTSFIQRLTDTSASHIFKLKMIGLLKAHDFNIFEIQFEHNVDFNVLHTMFANISSSAEKLCSVYDYVLEMFEFIICVLKCAITDLSLKKQLFANFLRFCTFLINKHTNEITGLIEKYKRPGKDVILIHDLNDLLNNGFDVLYGVKQVVMSWVTKPDVYTDVFQNLTENFTQIRATHNKSKMNTRYALNVSQIDVCALTSKTRYTLFFMGAEWVFTLLNKMNRWLNINEATNFNPFQDDLVGKILLNQCSILLYTLVELLDIDFCVLLDTYHFLEYVKQSKVWLLKCFFECIV